MSSNERLQCSILFSKQWLISDSLCPFELQNANDIASHIWPGLGMMSKIEQSKAAHVGSFRMLHTAHSCMAPPFLTKSLHGLCRRTGDVLKALWKE